MIFTQVSKVLASCLVVLSMSACIPAGEPKPEPPEPVALGPAPEKYVTNKPYKNRSGGPIIVRSGPEADAPQVSTLENGDAGTVQTCEPTETRCQITFGEFGAVGWVDMSGMSL